MHSKAKTQERTELECNILFKDKQETGAHVQGKLGNHKKRVVRTNAGGLEG